MPAPAVDVPSRDAGVVPEAGGEGSSLRRAADGARRDIVAIGTSAGGVEALKKLVAALPSDYRGALPAVSAIDQMPIEHGRIHVAPPDFHLLVERDLLRVVRGPRENRHRPAIDPLFRLVAWAYGPRAIGVVLTGNLDDGTAGLWAIKSCGGTTVVQEPNEADHPNQGVAVEESLYTAVRSMQEKAAALRRLAERWPERMPSVKHEYELRAADLDRSADVLRGMLARKQL